MSNRTYKLMILTYRIMDLFLKPGNILKDFNIKEGYTVVDYGCGPGRYVDKASQLVGKSGTVYALDINKIGIDNVIRKIENLKLDNVVPVHLKYSLDIKENSADIVYALDMFHQVDDIDTFFKNIHNIIKKDGFFYLQDGHQPRKVTKKKVSQFHNLWEIDIEEGRYLKLKPKNK